MELGGKWDVLRHRLALTGAVFRTEVSDSREYGDDELSPVRALPSKRVKGAELGVQGNLTEQWSVYGGMSRLMSKQTKGANRGSEAKNVPDLTFNLWTSYEAMRGLVLSYGAQHVGKRRYSDNAWVGGLNNNSSTVAGPAGRAPTYVFDTEKAPSYWVQSFAARYRVSARLALNLNVQNLANKFYWARIGSSLDGFQLYGVPGAGRSRGQWRSACSRWCCRPCGATSCSFRPRCRAASRRRCSTATMTAWRLPGRPCGCGAALPARWRTRAHGYVLHPVPQRPAGIRGRRVGAAGYLAR